MNDIILSVKDVNGIKSHNIGRRSFRLEQINFELPRGYIMGILGKNGAGKTTFFDYIMNRKRRYSGEICLNQREIHEDHLWTLNRIGFVSEENQFMELRSAEQNARMLGRFYSDFDMNLFEQVMEKFHVIKSKPVGKMSRGEQMKFQLAFAIAHKPELFLLDEMTSGMDPVARIEFYHLLKSRMTDTDCSAIISTHIEEEIEKQLDYIGLFEEGKFVSFHENTPI